MSKSGFNLADYAKKSMGDAMSGPDIDTEVLKIPAEKIDVNSANFYEQSDLDALAASIELTGLMHPPIVKEQDGRYVLIDGERRFRAMTQELGWETVPCIVRKPASSVIEELMLIEANRQQRKMSAGDLSKQAERYTELLAELKRSGMEIPGRLRTVVAEALQVSESKLARLSAIRNKLIPALLARFDAGEINETSAYALSQYEPEYQELWTGAKDFVEWQITNAYSRWRSAMASHSDDCSGCTHLDAKRERIKESIGKGNIWSACCGCCLICYMDCDKRCAASVAKKKERDERMAVEDAEFRARQKAAAEVRKARDARIEADSEVFWAQVKRRMDEKGVGLEELAEAVSYDADALHDVLTGEDELDFAFTEFGELFDFAEALGCTVGELFGGSVSSPDTGDGWHRTETDGMPDAKDTMSKILLTVDDHGKPHLLNAANFEAHFKVMPDWCIQWRLLDLPEEQADE